MKSIGFNLSALTRPVRFLIACCVCAVLVFSSVSPAYSITSKPTEGEANLTEIERKSQEAIAGKSPYDFDMERQQKATNPGLNEIQGTADIENMKRPENSQGQSIQEKVENALEKVTGRD